MRIIWLISYSLITICRCFQVPHAKAKPRICGSIIVMKSSHFSDTTVSIQEVVNNCDIIQGEVVFSIDPPFKFPILREVTGNFIIMFSEKLESLDTVFPNLSVVRGLSQVHGYAFVVSRNRNLQRLKLKHLQSITNGNILISNNPSLSYARSVNWNRMSAPVSRATIENNFEDVQPFAFCSNDCRRSDPDVGCWDHSANDCQQACPLCLFTDNCGPGPTCCHEFCIGGCLSSPYECVSCRFLRIYGTGECLSNTLGDRCPTMLNSQRLYKFHDWLCFTEEECLNIGKFFLFKEMNNFGATIEHGFIKDDECFVDCPPGFKPNDTRCIPQDESESVASCLRRNFLFKTDLRLIEGCSHIGTLFVSFSHCNTQQKDCIIGAEEFRESFKYVKYITNKLLVRHSTNLRSLQFLSNLKGIGNKNTSDRLSLEIIGNNNLIDLWTVDKSFKFHGNVIIARNPLLCISTIENFFKAINYHPKPNNTWLRTNGYLRNCESEHVVANLGNIQANSVEIIWDLVQNDAADKRTFGYDIFYTTDDISDDKSQVISNPLAALLRWKVVNVPFEDIHRESLLSDRCSYVLTSLEAARNYTVYVKAFNFEHDYFAASSMMTFSTLQTNPGEVVNVFSQSINESSIFVKWNPPLNPNGPVTKYLIYYGESTNDFLFGTYCHSSFYGNNENDGEKIGNTFSISNISTESRPQQQPSKGDTEFSESGVRSYDLENLIMVKYFPKKVHESDVVVDEDLKEALMSHIFKHINASFAPMPTRLETSNETFHGLKNLKEHGLTNEVVTNQTFVFLNDLKYATVYVIQIFACHDFAYSSRHTACSVMGYTLNVRTLPASADKDKVTGIKVASVSERTGLSEGKYNISWIPPVAPNGFIFNTIIKISTERSKRAPLFFCVERNLTSLADVVLSYGDTYKINVAVTTLSHERIWSDSFLLTTPSMSKALQFKALIISLPVALGLLVLLLFSFVALFMRNSRKTQCITKNPAYISYAPDEWEIDRKNIKLFECIGKGNFGSVYRGQVNFEDGRVQNCAVKVCSSDIKEPLCFLTESSVMKRFRSPHIVQLVGIVSQSYPPYVIMEFMENGCLLNYLHSFRTAKYPLEVLSKMKMIQMAADIADGMLYLSDLKFVHRDLAARNCLVSSEGVIKIGDFGLTRDIYDSDLYVKQSRGLLPIRWMAPESLRDGFFDGKSDVWSFGVLLWEITSLGEQPYQGLSNEEILRLVKNDLCRLPKPSACPDLLWNIMQNCWCFSAKERISFQEIIEQFLPCVNDKFRAESYVFSRKVANANEDNMSVNSTHAVKYGSPIDNSPETVPFLTS